MEQQQIVRSTAALLAEKLMDLTQEERQRILDIVRQLPGR